MIDASLSMDLEVLDSLSSWTTFADARQSIQQHVINDYGDYERLDDYETFKGQHIEIYASS